MYSVSGLVLLGNHVEDDSGRQHQALDHLPEVLADVGGTQARAANRPDAGTYSPFFDSHIIAEVI